MVDICRLPGYSCLKANSASLNKEKLMRYLKDFITDWRIAPRHRGPIARALYAHMTAVGWE